MDKVQYDAAVIDNLIKHLASKPYEHVFIAIHTLQSSATVIKEAEINSKSAEGEPA